MSYIVQQEFDFESKESAIDDHSRLIAILKNLPSHNLIRHLKDKRKGRREKQNPTSAMWNCFIACVVYDHDTIASFHRELMRNRDLRYVCFGHNRKKYIPQLGAFYRFLRKLSTHESLDLLREMFNDLVKSLQKELPGFGQCVAGDSSDVSSHSRGNKDRNTGLTSDPDASWRKYDRKYVDDSGNVYKSIKKWFGYKLHLLVDSMYELPIGFSFTSANENDAAPMKKVIEGVMETHEDLKIETASFDGAYDSNDFHKFLWGKKTLPVIHHNKRSRKEPEGILNDRGVPTCVNGCEFYYKGRDGEYLKYECPNGKTVCCLKKCETRVVKLKIGMNGDFVNYRALPTHTLKFTREYKKRTSVERVFSRLKKSYRLDKMSVMGQAKISALGSLSLLCMMSFARAMIGEGRPEQIRKAA